MSIPSNPYKHITQNYEMDSYLSINNSISLVISPELTLTCVTMFLTVLLSSFALVQCQEPAKVNLQIYSEIRQ